MNTTTSLTPATQTPNNDRREFLRSGTSYALGVGFALSVTPSAAQEVIKTDSTGLVAGEISIVDAGYTLRAYRAQPEGQKNLPTVLVISEIFGVHEHIADVCRRLARLGYLAIAPELFSRWGDPRSFTNVQELITNVISKTEDAAVLRDLDSCAQWASSNNGDADQLFVTGFCFGGRITWLYSAHNPQVKAAVAWYGRLEGTGSSITPTHPIDVARKIHAPVLGLYGGADSGIPQTSIDKMRIELAQGNNQAKASLIEVYPDAPHAFHADYRPSYRAAAAKDGWQRLQVWFNSYRKS